MDSELEKLAEIFGIGVDVHRSRDLRAIKNIEGPDTTEQEIRELKAKVNRLFAKKHQKNKKGLDDEGPDAYHEWKKEQEKLQRSKPALIDSLAELDSGKMRQLNLEDDIRSMKSDILDEIECQAAKLIGEKLILKGIIEI